MKPAAPIQSRNVARLRCHQCGHEYSQSDFIRGWNLCDHLALDALDAAQSRMEQRTLLSSRKRHKTFYQNDLVPYACCQRLIASEEFFDVEIHTKFEGHRLSHVAK